MDTDFSIGSRYSLTIPSCLPDEIEEAMNGITEIIKEKADETDFDLPDNFFDNDLHLDGTVVYNNGVTAIVKVDSKNMELDFRVLFYDKLTRLFPDYKEEKPKRLAEYYCIDIESEIHLFEYDDEKPGLLMARFDDDHIYEGHTLMSDDDYFALWCDGLKRLFLKRNEELVSISISETDLNNLSVPTGGNVESGDCLEFNIPRLQRWFLEKDCAILTTWRDGQSQKLKYSNNKQLQTELRSFNYGVVKVEGRYPEAGKDFGRERSFLVVNMTDDRDFYKTIYSLSTRYEQDSFLYKAKDDTSVYLIGTNEDFICKNGEKIKLGPMVVNKMDEECYTKVKGGRISFVQNPE